MTASEVILTYWSWPLFLKVQGTSQAHNHIISKSKSTELQSSCLIKTKLRKIRQDMLLVDDRHPPSDIIKRTWGGVGTDNNFGNEQDYSYFTSYGKCD